MLHHVQGPESLQVPLAMGTERRVPRGREEATGTARPLRPLSHRGPINRTKLF